MGEADTSELKLLNSYIMFSMLVLTISLLMLVLRELTIHFSKPVCHLKLLSGTSCTSLLLSVWCLDTCAVIGAFSRDWSPQFLVSPV